MSSFTAVHAQLAQLMAAHEVVLVSAAALHWQVCTGQALPALQGEGNPKAYLLYCDPDADSGQFSNSALSIYPVSVQAAASGAQLQADMLLTAGQCVQSKGGQYRTTVPAKDLTPARMGRRYALELLDEQHNGQPVSPHQPTSTDWQMMPSCMCGANGKCCLILHVSVSGVATEL